jgi:hypothetical protein
MTKIALALAFLIAFALPTRAEIRSMDISIFGMD